MTFLGKNEEIKIRLNLGVFATVQLGYFPPHYPKIVWIKTFTCFMWV